MSEIIRAGRAGWRLSTQGHDRAVLNPEGKRVKMNGWNFDSDVVVVLARDLNV